MKIPEEQMIKINKVIEKLEKTLDSETVLSSADIDNVDMELNEILSHISPVKYFKRLA
jgi:hypothetical protein